jgi:3-dehydroquinate dehydratase
VNSKARHPERAVSPDVSILILRGPNAGTAVDSMVPPLVERAADAGKAIAVRSCRNEGELIECLRGMRAANAELLLLDPGACLPVSDNLRGALEQLSVPYIEVHDDDMNALEPSIAPDCGQRLRLIHGYAAQSYTLALAIALEHLGCAESGNDVHVGT